MVQTKLILDDNQEQLVADLTADFSERINAGDNPSIEEYLAKLPDEECKTAFVRVANLTRFLVIGTAATDRRDIERATPEADAWEHNERNADTNGHSHVKAAMIGPSVVVPFTNGELSVGTWQKIVCIDFDDRPRSRRLVVQLLGV